ncbi:hypothetical protein AQJ58_18670 [Streptomyces sp. DSM 15324]|nr:hypothetical protein AQJ58_18670 [Streptomyces sp. DSM 15324]
MHESARQRGLRSREGGRRASGRATDTLADPTARARIQPCEDLLEKHGVPPDEAAPARLLARPGGTGPSVGPRTAEQLDSASRAVGLEPSEGLLEGLDEIFSGPGRARGRPRRPSPGRSGGARAGGTARPATAGPHLRATRSPRLYLPSAAARATTTNINTSAPAMIRFRVFGSTHRA